jgi:hypothetical protein
MSMTVSRLVRWMPVLTVLAVLGLAGLSAYVLSLESGPAETVVGPLRMESGSSQTETVAKPFRMESAPEAVALPYRAEGGPLESW